MKKIFYVLRNFFFPYIAYFIITLISRTLHIRKINSEMLENLERQGKRIIYVFWHGQQFVMVYAHKDKNIAILTSLSKDGEMQTKILQKFGYYCIRGSSSKGGVQALKEIIRAVRDGKDSAFAIDGPKGPLHKAKPGAVFLAQITGAIILPVACCSKPAFIFEKAWDKYILPYPFSKSVLIYGEPILVDRNDSVDNKILEIEKALNDLTIQATKLMS